PPPTARPGASPGAVAGDPSAGLTGHAGPGGQRGAGALRPATATGEHDDGLDARRADLRPRLAARAPATPGLGRLDRARRLLAVAGAGRVHDLARRRRLPRRRRSSRAG